MTRGTEAGQKPSWQCTVCPSVNSQAVLGFPVLTMSTQVICINPTEAPQTITLQFLEYTPEELSAINVYIAQLPSFPGLDLPSKGLAVTTKDFCNTAGLYIQAAAGGFVGSSKIAGQPSRTNTRVAQHHLSSLLAEVSVDLQICLSFRPCVTWSNTLTHPWRIYKHMQLMMLSKQC